MPASAEINRAIETLRAAGLHPARMGELDRWNAKRLQADAAKVTSQADMVALFDGLSPLALRRAGIT